MRRRLMIALGLVVLAAGVATLVMWLLAIVAVTAHRLGLTEQAPTLGGIAQGTVSFTIAILFVVLIDRNTNLLTWKLSSWRPRLWRRRCYL